MNDYVVFENIKANLIGVYRKNNLLLGLQIKRYIKILALWPPGSSLYRDKNKKLIFKVRGQAPCLTEPPSQLIITGIALPPVKGDVILAIL